MKIWQHFKTITYHKYLVAQGCFAVGLYWQGLCHDLSKYMPSEFLVGARYYQGDRSPNNAEREAIGYSSAWLHHKGRNRHHYEYWMDYGLKGSPNIFMPAPMPMKYIIEMFMDRVAASKVYNKGHYTDQAPLDYYEKGNTRQLLHPDTAQVLEKLLHLLAKEGEEATYAYIRSQLLHKGRRPRI